MQQRVRGGVGETLEGEVGETESSRGSGVYMSQSRRDGNYSALSWMHTISACLEQLHPRLHHIDLYHLSGRDCPETLQAGKKCGAHVADG